MTAGADVVRPGGLRSVATVAGYVCRACFPTRRLLGLLVPAAGAVALGLLARLLGEPPDEAFALVTGRGIFGVVLPIGCLVVGDAVLGAEVRAGTLHLTWLSPVGFAAIVAGRFLAGWTVAVVTLAVPCAIAAFAAGAGEAAGDMFLAASAASAAYVALFVAIAATVRRAVIWSLAFVVLIERLLGTALASVAQWSPSWLARAVYAGLAPGGEALARQGVPQGGAGFFRLVILSALALAVSAWRIRRLHLTGPSGD